MNRPDLDAIEQSQNLDWVDEIIRRAERGRIERELREGPDVEPDEDRFYKEAMRVARSPIHRHIASENRDRGMER